MNALVLRAMFLSRVRPLTRLIFQFHSQHQNWKSQGTRLNAYCQFTTHHPYPRKSTKNEDEGGNKKNGPSQFSESEGAASLFPGIALSAATAAAGFQLASVMTTALAIPISGIPVSILLGMTIKNSVGYSNAMNNVIKYSTKNILQGGIIAVAAKLSYVELLTTGSQGLPVVIGAVGAGLAFIPLAGKWAGLPREMSLLLTAGTSICGVTAITALAPAIKASNRDIAVAVANTVAFGTFGMLAYPYILNIACSGSEQVGMCLGVAIHDTSQVIGSAMSYKETFDDEIVLKVAAITKLTRNLGLAFAIPGLTYLHAKEQHNEKQEVKDSGMSSSNDSMFGLNTFQKYVPSFLVAFIGMACFRSTGDYFFDEYLEIFQQSMNFIGNDVSKYALGTAMAGVGLSTSMASLQGVGWKPFAVGASGTLVVGGTGFAIASLVV